MGCNKALKAIWEFVNQQNGQPQPDLIETVIDNISHNETDETDETDETTSTSIILETITGGNDQLMCRAAVKLLDEIAPDRDRRLCVMEKFMELCGDPEIFLKYALKDGYLIAFHEIKCDLDEEFIIDEYVSTRMSINDLIKVELVEILEEIVRNCLDDEDSQNDS